MAYSWVGVLVYRKLLTVKSVRLWKNQTHKIKDTSLHLKKTTEDACMAEV